MNVYKRLLEPLRKESLLIFLSIISGLLSAVLNLSRPILLGIIIDNIVKKEINRLFILIGLYACSWILTWTISIALQYLCTKVSQKVLKDLRNSVFRHFLSLPFIELERIKQGKIEAYTISDLPAWSSLYGTVLAECVHSIAQFSGALIGLSHMNIILTISIIPFLILSLLMPAKLSKTLRVVSLNTQNSKSESLENLSSLIRGVKDLISLSGKKWAIDNYSITTNTIYRSEIKQDIFRSILRISGSISETIAYIVAMGFGTNLVLNNKLGIGELVSFLATIEMLFYPLRNAGDLFGSVQYSIGAASRVWEFLDKKFDTINTLKVPPSFEFKNVYFRYTSGQETLKNLNITIKKGEYIIVIGESGVGKSTFLKLLSGLYQPTKGEITYSEKPDNVSVVWQEPTFFNTSLIENLTLGKSIDEKQLENLLEYLNLLREHCKDTLEIENSGENFSGGQKRRLAIIRALLQNPKLLILDEPTAGLDMLNSQKVWELIENMNNVTRIVSTHDLAVTKRADKIIVLQQEGISEIGSPKELIEKKGKYYKILKESDTIKEKNSNVLSF